MSGKSPRQKGDRLERAVVLLLREHGLDAKRVPLSGSAKGYPGDVVANMAGRELCLECKSRKDFKTLHAWLEHRDALILKADRKEALVVLRLADFLKALGGLSDAALIEASQPVEHELDDEVQA
jgi:Holliday junction resolvase